LPCPGLKVKIYKVTGYGGHHPRSNLSQWFEYWGKGGQTYFLTKSDGMHPSEVRRAHFKGGGPH